MSDPRFTVAVTNLTPDAAVVSPDAGRRALGKIDEAALVSLLEKFAGASAAADDDCDPHVTVTGRSGTFALRPCSATTLLAYDVADAARNFVRLEIAGVPAFLDYGAAGQPVEPVSTVPAEAMPMDEPAPRPVSRTKGALATVGALAALSALAVSAQVNFSVEPLDADVAYTAVSTAAEATRLRSGAVGEYRANNTTQCALVLRADGTVVYTSQEIDGEEGTEFVVPSQVALLGNGTPVLRTEIGPIEVRDGRSLLFAGEIFTRTR